VTHDFPCETRQSEGCRPPSSLRTEATVAGTPLNTPRDHANMPQTQPADLLMGFVLNLLTPFLIAGGLTDPALARQAAQQAIMEAGNHHHPDRRLHPDRARQPPPVPAAGPVAVDEVETSK
jgi:hypothetical protein